jgi:hypothetical protein
VMISNSIAFHPIIYLISDTPLQLELRSGLDNPPFIRLQVFLCRYGSYSLSWYHGAVPAIFMLSKWLSSPSICPSSTTILSLISTSPTCSRNWRILLAGRDLVKPSAIISLVGVYTTLIFFRCTSCRSQWLWISMCWSLVVSWEVFSLTSRIVCLLSHWIVIVKSSSLIPSSVCSRTRNCASFAACARESSSASVVDVVTVSCLFARHAIAPPNSLRINSWELFLSTVLSANDASLATTRPSFPPNCSPRARVW